MHTYKKILIFGYIIFSCNSIFSMDEGFCHPLKKVCTQQDIPASDKQESHTLAKKAWQAAYSGQYKQANDCLHQAAQLGNITACAYLAHGYQHGNLIINVDTQQAEHYEKLTDRLLQQQTQTDRWSLNFKIDTKNNYILGHDFARQHPWYQQLEPSLKKIRRTLTKKHFHFHKPYDDLKSLISLYIEDKIDSKQIPVFAQGIREFNDDRLYDDIFKLLGDRYNPIEEKKKNFLLTLVQDWALTHDRKKKLGKVYVRYLSKAAYEDTCTLDDNKKALEVIPVCFDCLPKDTLQYLDRIIKQHINYLTRADSKINEADMLFEFLKAARKYGPDIFEKSCAKILNNRLEDFIIRILQNPDILSAFEDSPISINNVLQKVFENAQTKEGKPDAFDVFLEKYSAFHVQYQDRIIQILQTYLKLHRYHYESIITLLSSPLPNIRVTAFQSLTEYITTLNDYAWSHKNISDKFFAADVKGIIGSGTTSEAYRYFYQACIKNNNIQAMQRLWLYLSKIDDRDICAFVLSTIKEFFQLPNPLPLHVSFDTALNNAIKTALKEHLIPVATIRQFLICANDTGLSKMICPSFLTEYKTFCVLQEETPLRERCQFLNDLLKESLINNKSYEHITTNIDFLPESCFKEYAKTVIATLNPNQTFYEHFSNRRKLRTMQKSNTNLIESNVVSAITLECYHAFWDPIFESGGDSRIHIFIERRLEQAQLEDNLIFGYVANERGSNEPKSDVRLYACDSQDGYAVWACPLKLKKKRPFVIKNDIVYCISDNNEIIMYNKHNGDWIRNIKLPIDKRIKALHITENNILFVVYKEQGCVVNLETGKCLSYEFPLFVNYRTAQLMGEKIIFFAHEKESQQKKILTVDSDCQSKMFDIESSDNGVVEPSGMVCNKQVLWYTPDKKQIIFLEITSGNKICDFQLSSILQTAALKGDKLFLLTEKQLMALDISKLPINKPTVLWQTSIDSGSGIIPYEYEITKIDVSAAGNGTIYGIHDRNGTLFRFDSQTGTKSFLYNVKHVRNHKLLGTYNGTLYIQPISF